MIYSKEVELMCPVAKGAKHEPAPIPEEGKWVHSKKIEDISGFTHGVGWCAPQQGACKLTLNVKNGIIEEAFATDGSGIRRICQQAARKQLDLFPEDGEKNRYKMLAGANVLLVANRYDEITAMTLQGTAQSEVKALQELLEHPEVYDPETVRALIRSINILPPGASVELSTGEKALVLNENEESVLRPTVVSFRDNSILNLSLPGNEDIQIVDVMKTMDNRYIFNK